MGRKTYQQLSESQAWFKMLRISNAPTIFSNVMVGLALAIQSQAEMYEAVLASPRLEYLKPLGVISIALLLIYFSGMIFNDAADAAWDKKNRPDRPIPIGVIRKRDAWLTASFMLGCGVLLSGMYQWTGAMVLTILLALTVVAYTFLHRWLIPAVVLMALSRAAVYVIVMTALRPPPPFVHLLGFCIAIGVYTALLTFIGRKEHTGGLKHAWLVLLMLIPPCIPIVMYGDGNVFVWFMLVAFTAWMVLAWRDFRLSTSQPVAGMHKLLAGFCLLDCVLIASTGEFSIMIVSLICFVFTVAAHRKVMGT